MRLDASYNLCSKLESTLNFWRSYGSFSFAVKVPDHFTILSAFSIGGCFSRSNPIKSMRGGIAANPQSACGVEHEGRSRYDASLPLPVAAGAHRYYRVPLLKVSRLGKCTVWKCKTKTAMISSKNQFRPQFWEQIVAGVETHPYCLFLGPGGHFWQSYEENQVQNIFCRNLPNDFEKSKIDICTRISHFAKRTVGFRPHTHAKIQL